MFRLVVPLLLLWGAFLVGCDASSKSQSQSPPSLSSLPSSPRPSSSNDGEDVASAATVVASESTDFMSAINPRVVGGRVADPNIRKHLALIVIQSKSGDRYSCTGTVIGRRWILCAAHCFVDMGGNSLYEVKVSKTVAHISPKLADPGSEKRAPAGKEGGNKTGVREVEEVERMTFSDAKYVALSPSPSPSPSAAVAAEPVSALAATAETEEKERNKKAKKNRQFVPENKVKKLKSVFVHKNFANTGLQNDIAVVELNSSIELGFYNRTQLGSAPESERVVLAAGYGALDEDGTPAEKAMQTKLLSQRFDTCMQAEQANLQHVLDERIQVCATSLGFPEEGKTDTCYGDSGGPLFRLNKGNAVQYGITSYSSSGCAQAGGVPWYTRISAYKGAVLDVMANASSREFRRIMH